LLTSLQSYNKIQRFAVIGVGLALLIAFIIIQQSNLGLTVGTYNEFRILFVGDTSFGENYQTRYKEQGRENILEERGYDYSLQNLESILMRSDLVIANLETPITDMKVSPLAAKEKEPIHWTDVEMAPKYLKKHNIKTVSLANNHAMDYGLAGLEQSLRVLRENDMQSFGAGLDSVSAAKPYLKQFTVGKQVFTVAIIGAFEFRENYEKDFSFYANGNVGGVNKLDIENISIQIKQLKETIPNVFVIVFPHWNQNYVWKSKVQTELAHQIIDAGADLIIGHGAHMMQEIEKYHGRWIMYSIGNFMFNSEGRYEELNATPFSLAAELLLHERNETLLKTMRLYPIYSDNQNTNFQPRFLDQDEFENAYELLLESSPTPDMLEKEITMGKDDIGPFIEFLIE